MVLIDIRNMLLSMGKDIKSFPLSDINGTYDDVYNIPQEIVEETTIEHNNNDVTLSESLNDEQRAAYDEIMSTIDTDCGGLFFVDGSDGIEKTYLYRALLANV